VDWPGVFVVFLGLALVAAAWKALLGIGAWHQLDRMREAGRGRGARAGRAALPPVAG
jgi:hypothetical protein